MEEDKKKPLVIARDTDDKTPITTRNTASSMSDSSKVPFIQFFLAIIAIAGLCGGLILSATTKQAVWAISGCVACIVLFAFMYIITLLEHLDRNVKALYEEIKKQNNKLEK